MRKEETLLENHTPFTYGLRNPYRNFKSGNSQDYAQKHQRNSTFMNSASVHGKRKDQLLSFVSRAK
jgi:hypothetical protein